MIGGLADSRPGPGCMQVSRCSWQAARLTGGLPAQIRWASEGTLGARLWLIHKGKSCAAPPLGRAPGLKL